MPNVGPPNFAVSAVDGILLQMSPRSPTPTSRSAATGRHFFVAGETVGMANEKQTIE
jgi:hypothetical protein